MSNPIKDEWQSDDSSIRLILGDCLEVLPVLSGIDAVVTDPPYGIGKAEWDSEFRESDLDLWFSVAKKVCVIPGIWALGLCIKAMGSRYVWTVAGYKPSAMTNGRIGLNKWQPVVIGGEFQRCGADAFQFHPSDTGLNGHPCQKPEQFMDWIVSRLTVENTTILDPYMGSGTTGVACIRMGRRFIGIEIGKKYWQIAVDRCKKAIREDNSSFKIRPKPKPVPVGFFTKGK